MIIMTVIMTMYVMVHGMTNMKVMVDNAHDVLHGMTIMTVMMTM
jgi:hypothetical protein